jgi:hypothetical protein
LPRRSVRSGREPAHIGEALPADLAAGNPEGSPSDPVTTDPKGEARPDGTPSDNASRNTPALIEMWSLWRDDRTRVVANPPKGPDEVKG